MFNCLLVNKDENGYKTSITELAEESLSQGNVSVKVLYSTLNYKDALAITGKAPVVRSFPMIPGVDFSGIVEHSESDEFKVGDKVLLNGFGVGEKHMGGLSQKAKVNSDWLIPLPEAISPLQAMEIGTAGYTAMLCIQALEKGGINPQSGKILVTGATGGVGSFAVKLLSLMGYTVVASTGSNKQHEYLYDLGASEIIDREELSAQGKPLMKEKWAGAIDSIGSHTLANVCASIQYGGAVAACGLAQGMDLPATVAPFILRGVSLLGVDSVMRPRADRVAAWKKLAEILPATEMESIAEVISLASSIEVAEKLLKGEVTGRVVVDVNK
ncbi:acrylyl-CoA reductase (NADPH) [Colwellia psychrerythraea]|uniref:Quinone oxidoreductase, YhdH/YhfP family n=1 Tax=Colwellia psychrerythraea TaxID=28229 RepID=A0A099KXV5_COLPS|nr:MDR family oxidoreductase [Colwellia psychrerythraea]KGJ94488.1 quinone oxidoreductase, YhdH/YhfP family [Colwellia psychrerythraea]